MPDTQMMLGYVKNALRITSDELDDEVQNTIDACVLDLSLAGIDPSKIVATDALAQLAVSTFAKIHFGFDNPEAERFQESYDSFKRSMALNSKYRKAVT